MYLLLSLWLLFNHATYSQQTHTCDSVYLSVDEMPKYKNGDYALLMKDFAKIRIGKGCNEYSSLYKINWVIDADGNMTDIEVPGVDGICRNSIISQLKHLQPWAPGRQGGKAVCVKFMMSVDISR